MSAVFTTAILCDQVRQEMSGKYIAIGIYSSAVIFGQFPAIGQFHVLARMRMTDAGTQKLKARVLVSGQESQRIEGHLEVDRPSEDWLVLPLQPIEFQTPGQLVIEQSDDEDNWTEFFHISVSEPPPTADP